MTGAIASSSGRTIVSNSRPSKYFRGRPVTLAAGYQTRVIRRRPSRSSARREGYSKSTNVKSRTPTAWGPVGGGNRTGSLEPCADGAIAWPKTRTTPTIIDLMSSPCALRVVTTPTSRSVCSGGEDLLPARATGHAVRRYLYDVTGRSGVRGVRWRCPVTARRDTTISRSTMTACFRPHASVAAGPSPVRTAGTRHDASPSPPPTRSRTRRRPQRASGTRSPRGNSSTVTVPSPLPRRARLGLLPLLPVGCSA